MRDGDGNEIADPNPNGDPAIAAALEIWPGMFVGPGRNWTQAPGDLMIASARRLGKSVRALHKPVVIVPTMLDAAKYSRVVCATCTQERWDEWYTESRAVRSSWPCATAKLVFTEKEIELTLKMKQFVIDSGYLDIESAENEDKK